MTNLLSLFMGTALFFAAAMAAWELGGFAIAWKLLFSDHHDQPKSITPSDRSIDSVALTIPVDNDNHISAWLLQPESETSLGGACVVMVHGYDSGKDKLWEFPEDNNYRACTLDQGAESLWQAGFHVVAMDLRNHGESSDNGPVTLGARESEDVLSVVDYLFENAIEFGIDPSRIALRGESMGAATCLIAAAKDTRGRVAGVWSDSAFSRSDSAILDFIAYKGLPKSFARPARRWLVRLTGVNLSEASPVDFVGQINCPVQIVHSSGDTMLSLRHFDELVQSEDWQDPPETLIFKGHQHNRLWRDPDYHQHQTAFFHACLGDDRMSDDRSQVA